MARLAPQAAPSQPALNYHVCAGARAAGSDNVQAVRGGARRIRRDHILGFSCGGRSSLKCQCGMSSVYGFKVMTSEEGDITPYRDGEHWAISQADKSIIAIALAHVFHEPERLLEKV